MLGTAGTLASEIFVLTGLAAEMIGPATFLAILLGGLLSFSIAINYSELATMYPETGGAMTYVREAWGKGLLVFVVGSMDSISSTFYCALCAVGFAYSLSVFFPSIPIVPVAIAAIIVFVILNLLGVTNVGNIQIVMGLSLLFAFATYIIAGFVSPNGFSLTTLMPNGSLFLSDGVLKNIGSLLKTIALVYAAYVGFEVIADDAEEVKNPSKNIPIAMLVSMLLITLVYSLTALVTLGTVPWQSVAGSKTALADAIRVFMPGLGVVIVAMAGMVGSLTSVNSSMLSATREAFTLSRDGCWPQSLARLNRVRVPFMAILLIGIVSILITITGAVDFLSYITSAGYLFVLFFSNLAMIVLRKKYPKVHRPFKAPLFPLTPILASITCIIVIIFSDLDAILFTGGVIALFAIYYFSKTGLQLWTEAHQRDLSPGRWRILLPTSNPKGMDGLMKVGSLLAEAEKDLNMCVLTVFPSQAITERVDPTQYINKLKQQRHQILDNFIHYAIDRNVPMYTKMIPDMTLADGIINEIKTDDNVKLLLMKWPEHRLKNGVGWGDLKRLIEETRVSLAVLRDRGIPDFQNILVPVGGGYNSRLAIHLANDIATEEDSHINFMRVYRRPMEGETEEDMISYVQEIVLTELGQIPPNATLQSSRATSVESAILNECSVNDYGLVIIGAADSPSEISLFGSLCDAVVEKSPYSVLVVRRHQSAPVSWLRQQSKRLQRD